MFGSAGGGVVVSSVKTDYLKSAIRCAKYCMADAELAPYLGSFSDPNLAFTGIPDNGRKARQSVPVPFNSGAAVHKY